PPPTTDPTTDPPSPMPSVSSAKPSPSRTAPPSAGSVEAQYQVTSLWDTGLVARVRVTNTGATAQPWLVVLVLPSGMAPTNVWNPTMRHTGQTSQFAQPDGTDPLAAGASVTFGFQSSRTGAYLPVSCTVNGVPCRSGSGDPQQ